MKGRIFHISTFIAYLILVLCLTACGGGSSENLQETNDTTMHENTTSESKVELQNDNNKSDEYTKITATIENTDDLKGTEMVPLENTTNISNRGMKFINESGLYTLIARSNKPEARKFQRWVTSEVLPSIRKTGSYGLQITKEDRLKLNVLNATDPDVRFKALSELEQYHTEQKKVLEDKNEQLEADNEILTQQRDKAIATKAQISTNREAVAVGRVGGLVAANNRLKDELYGNRNRRTIKAVAIANHLKDKDISYHKLIKYCKEHNLEIIKVPDTNWNEANSYPIEAFKAVYPELIID